MNNVNEAQCSDSLGISQNEKLQIKIFTGIVGLVSVCICILTIALIVELKLYRRSLYRKGLYQLVSSMVVLYSYILVVATSTNENILPYDVCQMASVLLNYCFLTNILFSNIHIFHFSSLYLCHKKNIFKDLESHYAPLSVVTPLFFTLISSIGDNYGPARLWCRRRSNICFHHLQGLTENSWYTPWLLFLTINLLIAAVLLALLMAKAYKRRSMEHKLLIPTEENTSEYKMRVHEVLPLLAYPIIFYFTVFLSSAYLFMSFNSYNQALVLTLHCVPWSVLSSCLLLLHILVVRCREGGKHSSL